MKKQQRCDSYTGETTKYEQRKQCGKHATWVMQPGIISYACDEHYAKAIAYSLINGYYSKVYHWERLGTVPESG